MAATDLANKLINEREKSGLSQSEVARRIGIDNSSLSRIESGTRKVSSDELRKFASLYGVTTDYLLNLNNTPAWATEKQVTDLKEWLDDPDANAGLSFGGAELTKEEKEKLKLSVTQIFWDRLKLERMPMPDARYMRKDGDDKK